MNKELRIKNKISRIKTIIHNSLFLIRKPKGFTLIELMVVMAVTIFVGGIIGSILFSSLRGTNKSNALTTVRQNGNFALIQMTKMIRDAKKLNSPCTISDTINFSSFSGGDTVFICDLSNPQGPTISSNGASLLDQNAVSVSSCAFTCTQNSESDYPTIGISFTLGTLTSQAQEKTVSIPFQTSVTMRNVGR